MNDKKFIKKNDLILIGIILAAVVIGLLVMKLSVSGGDELLVVVTVDGEEYAVLPLDEDTELLITNAEGGTNRLVITDGKAYIPEASCRNQICVHTGKISEEGEIIVCLPNKVVVAIESSKSR